MKPEMAALAEALTDVMRGHEELQKALDDKLNDEFSPDTYRSMSQKRWGALLRELGPVVQKVIEDGDYSAEEVGGCLRLLLDVLKEISPDVFLEDELEEEEARSAPDDEEGEVDEDDSGQPRR